MTSTISCTEERIDCLHNNAILTSDDNDGHLALLMNTSLKTTNS